MLFYRYEARDVAYAKDHDGEYVTPIIPQIEIELLEYKLVKETKRYYRISFKDFDSKWSKLVSKTAMRKFAYLTKEAALENYIKRTEKYVNILRKQIVFAEMALEAAKEFKI